MVFQIQRLAYPVDSEVDSEVQAETWSMLKHGLYVEALTILQHLTVPRDQRYQQRHGPCTIGNTCSACQPVTAMVSISQSTKIYMDRLEKEVEGKSTPVKTKIWGERSVEVP